MKTHTKARRKKRRCMFAVRGVKYIDYKDMKWLPKYISSFNRILPRRYTSNNIKYQKMLARAIKRARFMALLPYTTNHKMLYKD